jgi:lipoprotein-anchoring transpeptidase ErfK/SrfK
MSNILTRRSFLKLAGTALASAAFPSVAAPRALAPRLDPAWPSGPDVLLGRMVWPWGVHILSRPHPDGADLGVLKADDVVQIMREVVGKGIMSRTHVWYELEKGYVYKPYMQPVRNILNTPLTTLPEEGVWAEVTVPYIDGRLKPAADAKVLYRLPYSTVLKIKEIQTGPDGAAWYRADTETEVKMYAPAAAFRIISADEISPLSAGVDKKRVVVYLAEQALSAFEGKTEVFRTQISSGALFFGADGKTLTSGTPGGDHIIWQKRLSRHMQGGTREVGYDLPGVGWVAYFASNGAALHSTFWHNDFGTPKSHGCLNCRPEDAKWLFRWTAPAVPYEPGDITVNMTSPGTVLDIRVEA